MTDWEDEYLNGAADLMMADIENGEQEARWLMEYVKANGLSEREYRELVRRRANGEPLQYVMKSSQFYDVELDVGPGVLIPRPETEVLVELAEQIYPGEGAICDVCTGSGAIALSLAKAFPDASVTAVDISAEALEYARRNCRKLQLENVTLLQGDLFAPVPAGTEFVMITANPPYVSPSEYEELEPVVKDFEPKLALVAEEDGMAVIRRIAETAGRYLAPDGWLVMEIGEEQGERTRSLLEKNGFTRIQIQRDYTGRERIAIAQRGE